MEHDDLKAAWQSLEAHMARSERMQLALLRETRMTRARGHLRMLRLGHWLQSALGLGLIALGAAFWTRNAGIPGLLAAGLALHAFGVLSILGATLTLTLVLAARVDYSAPVLVIQRQLAALLRAYALNSTVCGLPWWIMWLPVVVAFAGLGDVPHGAGTPARITWSLAISAVGLAVTWRYGHRHRQRPLYKGAEGPSAAVTARTASVVASVSLRKWRSSKRADSSNALRRSIKLQTDRSDASSEHVVEPSDQRAEKATAKRAQYRVPDEHVDRRHRSE